MEKKKKKSRFDFDEENHIYTIGDMVLPSVTQILQTVLGRNRFWSKESREKGKIIHKAISLHLQDNLDEETVDEEIAEKFEAFKRFMLESKFQPDLLYCESPLYSRVYYFAGTPDLVGILNGCLVLIDIKTGQPSDMHSLQTMAYKMLLAEAGIKTEKRFCLYLKEYRYRLSENIDNSSDRAIFISALNLYNYKKIKGEKACIGHPTTTKKTKRKK